MGLRDKILNAKENRLKKINVPEWDTDVYIKVLSGRDIDRWSNSSFGNNGDIKNPYTSRAQLICYALADEDGTRIFQDNEVELVAENNGVDLLERLAEEIVDFNKLNKKLGESQPKDNSGSD